MLPSNPPTAPGPLNQNRNSASPRLMNPASLNRPSVLTPPSHMPNLTSAPNQALAKPPSLSSLTRPPTFVYNTNVLTAPAPKSFLSMPKNVLANPNLPPNINKDTSVLNNSLSNNSSVASELNNLSNTGANLLNQSNGMQQNSSQNFFSNSLPATNATAQLFNNNDTQKQLTNAFASNSDENFSNSPSNNINSGGSPSVNNQSSLNNSSQNVSTSNSLNNSSNNFVNNNSQLSSSSDQNQTQFINSNNSVNNDIISNSCQAQPSQQQQNIWQQQTGQPLNGQLTGPPIIPGQQQTGPQIMPGQPQTGWPLQTNQGYQQTGPQTMPGGAQGQFPQPTFNSNTNTQNLSQSQNQIPLPNQQVQRPIIPQHPIPFEPFRPMSNQSSPSLQNTTIPPNQNNFNNNQVQRNLYSNSPSQFNNLNQSSNPSPVNNNMNQGPVTTQPIFNPTQPTQPIQPTQPTQPSKSQTPLNSYNNSNTTLMRGPPTAADINQQVKQTKNYGPPLPNQGPPLTNQGPPLTNQPQSQVPTNQFNNMNINSSQPGAQPPQNIPQPSTQQFPNQQQPGFNRQPSQNQQTNNSSSNNSQNYNRFPPSNRSQPQSVDLLREKRLINEYSDLEEPVRPQFPHEFYTNVNCHPDTIRCTLTAIPESQNLLTKCRLPLGILIHPFKDLESLKVVQSSTIVRCRNCRSYINPFVHFIDNTKWRCNLCYSINDLPDEFLFDPVTRSYGDPSKRPEINSSTIEFIAPAEYTLRPPPPAMYLYLLDVSHNAVTTGYLQSFCETMLENLEKIPGDSRTQIGFITYNSSLHFYNLCDSLSQPRMMVYPDLEDVQLPLPDNLMINLSENKESIQLFLQSLPSLFADTYETDSALGTALNAGFQLLKSTGGRLTVMQTCLPNIGVGGLKQRTENVDKDPTNLAPQIDFYKKLALDCASVHIAVDLFMFNSQYADLATLSCISKYSGGEIKFYPEYHLENHPEQVIRFCVDFKRYLVRKIGFEAVMRIRCTRGLTIHTFHGNFFVRSTDLLALPNVNPDAGFGMQIAIEETLTDTPTVCFQAAVLYTSSKGERRIRIHTYCLPVSKNINELMNSADQECIVGLVAKMAVDRTTMSSLKEAKDAMINVASDYLQAYTQVVVSGNKNNSIISPNSLRLIPLLVLALMKNIAFRFGDVKIDERVYAMNLMKTMPLKYLMMSIYPHLYAIHNLDDRKVIVDASETEICLPPKLQLSSENIDRHGVYIMDAGEAIYMWIGRSVSDNFLQLVFDCKSFQELPDHSNDLPELDNILSERVRNFLVYLYDSRPFGPQFIFFREDSVKAKTFFQHMTDDKTESSVSYYEFLRHLLDQLSG